MIPLVLDDGVRGTLMAIDGERVSLWSERAAAPGMRLGATLADGAILRIKVHRSVRAGERFVIDGRALDLTRDLRERLEAELAVT